MYNYSTKFFGISCQKSLYFRRILRYGCFIIFFLCLNAKKSVFPLATRGSFSCIMSFMSASWKKYLKISLSLVFCLLVRLIPFRAPNVEPILATTMPISRAFGALSGFFFGATSILAYDLVTHTLGVQTFFTASAYGLLGFWAARYFKNKKVGKWSYIRFALIGTLFYDSVTGLIVGPILFHQPFVTAFIGQIPFTILHLTGNILFALTLSPAIYYLLVRKRERKSEYIINTLNPKTI